jgi:hypothetical protein
MPIHRLIYRLDFKTSYDILNGSGNVARILIEDFPDFFPTVGETKNWRQLAAKFSDERIFREIAVDPKSFVASIEYLDGVMPDSLRDDKSFAPIVKMLSTLCAEFKISSFSRAGFRVWMLEKTGLGWQGNREKLLGAVSKPLQEPAAAALGEVFDVGVAFDGRSSAKVSYHLMFGPYRGKAENKKYFPNLGEKFPEDSPFDFVIDLDQYEELFTYGNTTAEKWWRPLVDNTSSVASKYVAALKK